MKTCGTIIIISLISFISANTPEDNKDFNTAKDVEYLSYIEKEIIHEINLLRANPGKYSKDYIAPLAKLYKGKILHYPGEIPIKTQEGVKALNECVRVLKKASPQPTLHPSKELSKAASDHQKDQAKTGQTGHTGSDNSNLKERIERYGNWQVQIAENIAYGNSSARQVVISLLIDDGVQNRGHRKNLLNSAYNSIGVSFGKHPVYSTMCVMDLAGGIEAK